MKDEAPVRRHVNISAQSGAQLELRLHWLTRALAVHGGYIVATRRRSTRGGRQVAAVAYELPSPKFARGERGLPAGRAVHGSGVHGAEGRGSGYPGARAADADWQARQGQGTSSEAL